MKTEFMEQSDINCLSEFDPALYALFVEVLKNDETKAIYRNFAKQSSLEGWV